ncbi:hypothetical protein Syun_023338 [Stephania yunnanensis]|uniref:Uncharacterized protein n=1 Tax=Stephania yunnanensis TaxID=152371 RepID=A0AAP0FHW0_9MAGN
MQKPAFMFAWRNIVNTDKLRLCTLLENPWIHGSRTCLLWHERETHCCDADRICVHADETLKEPTGEPVKGKPHHEEQRKLGYGSLIA